MWALMKNKKSSLPGLKWQTTTASLPWNSTLLSPLLHLNTAFY